MGNTQIAWSQLLEYYKNSNEKVSWNKPIINHIANKIPKSCQSTYHHPNFDTHWFWNSAINSSSKLSDFLKENLYDSFG